MTLRDIGGGESDSPYQDMESVVLDYALMRNSKEPTAKN